MDYRSLGRRLSKPSIGFPLAGKRSLAYERRMTPEPPGTGRENLIIWLKILGLLAGIFAFGLLVFWVRRLTMR